MRKHLNVRNATLERLGQGAMLLPVLLLLYTGAKALGDNEEALLDILGSNVRAPARAVVLLATIVADIATTPGGTLAQRARTARDLFRGAKFNREAEECEAIATILELGGNKFAAERRVRALLERIQ